MKRPAKQPSIEQVVEWSFVATDPGEATAPVQPFCDVGQRPPGPDGLGTQGQFLDHFVADVLQTLRAVA